MLEVLCHQQLICPLARSRDLPLEPVQRQEAGPNHRLLAPSDAAEVSFVEIGQHQLPFAREMMSLRKWKRVKN